jgi:hypothetical protein
MIRHRQVAIVAAELDPVVQQLCRELDLTVCFNDPGVAEFGLHNALMMIGDQVLEVVAPVQEGTTAGRLLDKRGGDGGYMAIYEVDDLDTRLAHLSRHGVRVVWQVDARTIRGRHLHPRDVGGTLVSIDEPTVWGTWEWAGQDWTPRVGAATAIAGVVIGAHDPAAMRARWRELGLEVGVRFQPAGPRGEGLDEVELVAADRERAGESRHIGGVTFRFV